MREHRARRNNTYHLPSRRIGVVNQPQALFNFQKRIPPRLPRSVQSVIINNVSYQRARSALAGSRTQQTATPDGFYVIAHPHGPDDDFVLLRSRICPLLEFLPALAVTDFLS